MQDHIVEKCEINISMDSEEQSMQLQSFISKFAKEKVFKVIDNVFSKANYDQSKCLKIEKIDIDLGNIDYETFQDQFERRLEEQLRLQLDKEIYNAVANNRNNGNTKLVTHFYSNFEKIKCFLLYGCFPSSNALLFEHHKLLESVLKNSPKQFSQFLKKNASNEYLFKRLIKQFTNKQLEKLIETLEPSEAYFLIAYRLDVLKSRESIIASNLSPKRFEYIIWELILIYILSERGSEFNRKEFVKWNLNQYANKLNIPYQSIIEKLTSNIYELRNRLGKHSAWIVILEQIKTESVKNKKFPEKSNEPLDRLKTILLEHSAEIKDTKVFNESFNLASIYNREGLRDFLKAYGKQKKNRLFIVNTLTDRQIQELVQVVEPQEANFVIEYESDFNKIEKKGIIENANSYELRKTRWVIILEYLLEERGSVFNRKSFIKDNLKKQAAHLNISYLSLISVLAAVVKKDEINFRVGNQLPGLLIELKEEAEINQKVRLKHLHENKEILDAYDIFESLKNVLYRSSTSLAPRFAKYTPKELIDKLNKLRPELIVKLKTEIRSNPKLKISKNLEGDFMLVLVEAIVSTLPTYNKNAVVNFVIAIKNYAASINKKSLFYAHVLSAVVNNKNIDLEEIKNKYEYSDGVSLVIHEETDETMSNELLCILNEKNISMKKHKRILELLENFFRKDREEAYKLLKRVSKNRGLSEVLYGLVLNMKDANVNPANQSFYIKNKEYFKQVLLPNKRAGSNVKSIRFNQLIDLYEEPSNSYEVDLILQDAYSIFKENQEKVSNKLEELAQNRAIRKKWIQNFSGKTILQIISFIQPYYFNRIITIVSVIRNGIEKSGKRQLDDSLVYSFILDFLANNKPFDIKRFAVESFSFLKQSCKPIIGEVNDDEIIAQIEENNPYHSQNLVKQTIHYLKPDKKEDMQENTKTTTLEEYPEMKEEYIPAPNSLYINNAGLVIAGAFLPMLFDKLGLVENKKIKDFEGAEKAAHLLQYMVNESLSSPEYFLALNKILCGLEIEMPIKEKVFISEEEKSIVNSLIEAMIMNWKSIGNTSVEGFRSSFLQREGKLFKDKNNWNLLVENKPYDMLLDQIPWNISTIKLPWMENLLYVHWR